MRSFLPLTSLGGILRCCHLVARTCALDQAGLGLNLASTVSELCEQDTCPHGFLHFLLSEIGITLPVSHCYSNFRMGVHSTAEWLAWGGRHSGRCSNKDWFLKCKDSPWGNLQVVSPRLIWLFGCGVQRLLPWGKL